MKKSIFFILFTSLLVGYESQTFSQPKYKLEVRNIKQTSSTEFELELYISKVGGSNELFVKGQYALSFNPKIIRDTASLTMSYIFNTSELPENNQGKLCQTYVGGPYGYALYILAPYDNSGCEISDTVKSVRIGKYKVTSSLPFTSEKLMLNWRVERPNPFSKVWYSSEKLSLQLDNKNLNFELIGGDLELIDKFIQKDMENPKE